jgi:hypothetical protein
VSLNAKVSVSEFSLRQRIVVRRRDFEGVRLAESCMPCGCAECIQMPSGCRFYTEG